MWFPKGLCEMKFYSGCPYKVHSRRAKTKNFLDVCRLFYYLSCSLRYVIRLQACVCPWGVGAWSRGWVPGPAGGVSAPGGCLVRGLSAPRGVPAPGGYLLWGVPGGDPPTATAAGGSHPTGMHSCSFILFACAPTFLVVSRPLEGNQQKNNMQRRYFIDRSLSL